MTPLRRAAAALRDAAAALDELEAGGAPAPTARPAKRRRPRVARYVPVREVTEADQRAARERAARRGIRV